MGDSMLIFWALHSHSRTELVNFEEEDFGWTFRVPWFWNLDNLDMIFWEIPNFHRFFFRFNFGRLLKRLEAVLGSGLSHPPTPIMVEKRIWGSFVYQHEQIARVREKFLKGFFLKWRIVSPSCRYHFLLAGGILVGKVPRIRFSFRILWVSRLRDAEEDGTNKLMIFAKMLECRMWMCNSWIWLYWVFARRASATKTKDPAAICKTEPASRLKTDAKDDMCQVIWRNLKVVQV